MGDKTQSSSSAASNSEIHHESDGKDSIPPPSTGLKKHHLIERKDAMLKLVQLIKPESSARRVISVWGSPGTGKTTFVKSLYQSNKDFDGRFEMRAWLDPLRPFRPEDFIKRLFQQLSKKNDQDDSKEKERTARSKQGNDQNKNKEEESESLKNILKDNKCLIVVDDVSSKDEWDTIKLSFRANLCHQSTTIIVTTRDYNVAKHCSSDDNYIYNLLTLTKGEARQLFRNKVFKDDVEIKKFVGIPDMTAQEELILNKCDGLPLAISTIGSFLATRPKTVMEWRNLNRHISAELATNPEFGTIKTTLASSYDGLPYQLKSCFLYMSVFPEDHRIRSARLVRRWIAEGYSRGIHKMTEEEIGNSYVKELINRSLVQTSKGTEVLSYYSGRFGILHVHDLIREIGILKSTEENLVYTLEEGCNLNVQGTVRHLAVSRNWKRDKNAFKRALDLSRLRSLTVFGKWEPFFIADDMRFLRVLDLEDTTGLRNHDLQQIGKLLHLRYLSLRRCKGILRLPNSLGNLRQLQTLDIRDTRIIKLPKAVIKLRSLQYLRGGFVPGDESRPDGICSRCMNSFSFGEEYCFCYSIPFHIRENLKSCCCCCCCPLFFLAGLFAMGRILMKDGLGGLLTPRGVKVPKGIRKLKDLHTLGVVNVASGKAIFKELTELTQLRNLKVTGINKKNCKDFYSAIAKHECLESLSVRSEGERDLCDHSDDASSPPENLQRLKLYGYLVSLPKWIEGRQNLVKLTLRSSRISDHNAAMRVLGDLPNLAVLRLLGISFQGQELCFSFQQEKFLSLTVVDLDRPGDLKSVKFEQGASPKLEVIKFRGWWYYGTRAGLFSGLASLPSLKEFMLDNDDYKEEFLKDVQDQLARNTNGSRPVLKRC